MKIFCTKSLTNIADDTTKESAARAFFDKLNAMELPEYFNWAEEVFEGLHVRERGDHKALIWTDIAGREVKTYTYRELVAHVILNPEFKPSREPALAISIVFIGWGYFLGFFLPIPAIPISPKPSRTMVPGSGACWPIISWS